MIKHGITCLCTFLQWRSECPAFATLPSVRVPVCREVDSTQVSWFMWQISQVTKWPPPLTQSQFCMTEGEVPLAFAPLHQNTSSNWFLRFHFPATKPWLLQKEFVDNVKILKTSDFNQKFRLFNIIDRQFSYCQYFYFLQNISLWPLFQYTVKLN